MTRQFLEASWRVVVTTITSRVITYFDNRATDRQFLFTLDGPAYHTGQVASDDLEVNRPFPGATDPAYLTNNRRLCYAFRRELHADPPYVCRFGGIFTTMEDQGSDASTTRYTAYDPWQYMYSRPARDDRDGAFPPIKEAGRRYKAGTTRASDIALDMLVMSEVVDGESHIDYLTDPSLIEDTAILADPFQIEQAQSVGEVWDSLCDTGTIDIELRAIYDPARPGKVCELRITPSMGVIRYNTVMGWDRGDHSLMSTVRTVDRLANVIQFFSGAASAATPQVDAASVAANGKYWAQQILNGGQHQSLADFLALIELRMRHNGEQTITFNPVADRIGYRPLLDYKLGDYVPVWASKNLREPLQIDYSAFDANDPGASGYRRIYGIPITVDDNGVETVEGLVTSQDSPIG